MSLIHLHVYSAYSLLESTLSIRDIVTLAKNNGFSSIALTDRNVMYGAVSFYKECMEQGIKPIIGLTADIFDDEEHKSYPLILLAKNNEGYHNLMKISSAIQTKSPDGLPFRWLKGYARGLIAITPGIEGEIESTLFHNEQAAEKVLLKYKTLFGNQSFYLSLPKPSTEGMERAKIKQLADKTNTQLVAAHHICYLKPEDSLAYQALTCLKDNIKIEELDKIELSENERKHFASRSEMMEWYSSDVAALENTIQIAKECCVNLEFNQKLLPKYPVPNDLSAHQYLIEICKKGFAKRYPTPDKKHFERLEYELTVIADMGFSDYFLIVWDFMNHANKQGILTGPGRGSAAGSMVAYVLGITNVDPIEYNLLFERFLNPERITMPDIDIDFPDNRREEMIRYVAKKYGPIHVAQIITFGTFGAKAALRDAGRVCGLNTKELDQLSRSLPPINGLTIQLAQSESSRFRTWIAESALHKRIFEIAKKWEGLPRHTSIHAAGVIITDQPLTDLIPIQEGHEGVYLTQFPMEILEEIGLLKMDFLGLRNLTLLDQIVRQVNRSSGKKIQLSQIPLDDTATFELLSKGLTSGIFQFESAGMQNVLKKLKPTVFEDLVAVNALYRPGPMDNIPTFINRKHGIEPITFPITELETILKPTYGIIVYQEQIIQIASTMAGFSLGEADLLRRAVSKKKKDVLDEQRAHFVKGAMARGHEQHTANEVYDLIVRFANYGFNRSHAVAYSLIAYQLAYLKANYLRSFMAGLMTSVIGNDDKIAQYVQELKSKDYIVYPPSINKSHFPFILEGDKGVRYSLAAVKGIGASVLKELVAARKNGPFEDLFDVCIRIPSRIINRKVLENLCYAGAFDEFKMDRASILASIDVALEHAELVRPDSGEVGFFDADDMFIKPKYVVVDPMPTDKKLQKEKEVLGLYLSDHPISGSRPLLKHAGALPLSNFPLNSTGFVGAYIQSVKLIRTKKGENMAFLLLSDETGDMEGVTFPNVYKQYSSILKEGNLVLIEGKLEERNGKKQFITQNLYDLENDIPKIKELFKSVYIKVAPNVQTNKTLTAIRNVLIQYRGNTKVYIYYEKDTKTIQLSKENWVNPTPALLKDLERIIGEGNVLIKED
ncbi:DNA polymerase III subunit alpha [Bacillus sp. E214]|uniref:DNA polymerase III subunit alpha n=1 Tax=Bacillus sp. E214 TaxID=2587156 RepID=UPI0011E05021|nr:DNA polymerase III subunit alpha [Bacillus sp. E214]